MCYGSFPSGECCSSCKVVRSCKRESLKHSKSERQRKMLEKIRYNTLEKFSDKDIKIILFDLLSKYKHGATTYRLTKDFKKYYNVNVSDTKILNICLDMRHDKTIDFEFFSNARVWRIKNIIPVQFVSRCVR